jgi:hypothetical protein
MKRSYKKDNKRLINLVLLISVCGFLVLTAFEYINCRSDFPDELLDIASAYQNPPLPVFPPHRNNPPLAPRLLEDISYQRGQPTRDGPPPLTYVILFKGDH